MHGNRSGHRKRASTRSLRSRGQRRQRLSPRASLGGWEEVRRSAVIQSQALPIQDAEVLEARRDLEKANLRLQRENRELQAALTSARQASAMASTGEHRRLQAENRELEAELTAARCAAAPKAIIDGRPQHQLDAQLVATLEAQILDLHAELAAASKAHAEDVAMTRVVGERHIAEAQVRVMASQDVKDAEFQVLHRRHEELAAAEQYVANELRLEQERALDEQAALRLLEAQWTEELKIAKEQTVEERIAQEHLRAASEVQWAQEREALSQQLSIAAAKWEDDQAELKQRLDLAVLAAARAGSDTSLRERRFEEAEVHLQKANGNLLEANAALRDKLGIMRRAYEQQLDELLLETEACEDRMRMALSNRPEGEAQVMGPELRPAAVG